MFDLKQFFRRRQEGKIRDAEKARDQIRSSFTQRYLNFKTLLSLNDKVLEIINEMEKALEEDNPFGMAFVRGHCTALSVNLFKIIQSLNAITNGRHETLFSAYDRIWANIDQEMKKKKDPAQGDWVLPLEAVTQLLAGQVGNKMANLGEIKNRVGLSVPEGFAITASAYEYFLESAHLQDEINRRIQFLDSSNMAQLHETSSEIQKLITGAVLPMELEDAILSAYQELIKKVGEGVHVSMRSSALGEDAHEASFAGQYRSVLNVSPEYLVLSYKEILASKYSVPAITYRLNRGFLDEEIVMCVGCMAMVNAQSAGVMYSTDPGGIRRQEIVINAVLGLGKSVVDGSLIPDLFMVDTNNLNPPYKKEIQKKTKRIVCHPEEGVCLELMVDSESQIPALTDDQIRPLAEIALRLENHFGCPQDIEWAIEFDGSIQVLQSRPLLILKQETLEKKGPPVSELEHPIILEGGITASPGVACGPAFLIESTVDMLQFPTGAVLVARYPLPQWAALLNNAVAVVTDQGALTGHLAAVAREFKIPALMGTQRAFETIQRGELITVDANNHILYTGRVESLLTQSRLKSSRMKGSSVYRSLENILKFIAPLTLIDPEGDNFSPEGCQTLHDIIRFAHERSLRELFDDKTEIDFSEKFAKKLVSSIPMQWWIIDLEGGTKTGANGPTIALEDILSVPLLALWEGLAAVPWKGPPPVDTRGFLSILAESTMEPSLEQGLGSGMAAKNFAIISENFCHLSTRLGFHFSTIESYLGDLAAENYVWFYFKGGAADRQRKEQRGHLIRLILEKFHFWVQMKGDLLSARLERQEKELLKERLKVLGYVILHTRQLDMILADQGRVNWYLEEMMKEISTFVPIPN
ncbi:MAG: pyruvate, water dikinase [Desulfobacca sp.]|nr:pyruvate, water dikinase [Desulfobacca sp.]